MITSADWDKIKYKDPRKALRRKEKPMSYIFGLDTEAYTTGEPFMVCTSEGHVYDPATLPGPLFDDYPGANFMLYNIKYDSGALLYHLDRSVIYDLWFFGKAEIDRGGIVYKYQYIPHKLLRIRHGKTTLSFWDVAQFFQSSLDNAAKRYLDEHSQKKRIATKRFTPGYVARFRKSISAYCIQDALVTKRLGQYFIGKLAQFNIVPSSIYSPASISFKYFREHSRIVTSWRAWNDCPGLLKYACDAYEGGKFEVTARGCFDAHEYDITSAYPYEIANLCNLDHADFFMSPEYQAQAEYGFIRCRIDNRAGKHIPCGIMVNGVKTYPAGIFHLTITKQEYDYLVEIGLPVDIVNGWWIVLKTKRRPYRGVINYLFSIKDEYKGRDDMLYRLTKIAMNGFYGKTVQAITTPEGDIEVGAGWNPVYGAIITANTRIKVCRIQNMLNARCLAVHTDSVFTLDPLPPGMLSPGLGNFEKVTSGRALLIACGMYQIGRECAFKGFHPVRRYRDEAGKWRRREDTWEDILQRNRHRKIITDRVLRVESWIEAMAKNHEKKKINVFEMVEKKIDLNCDTKRNWTGGKWKAGQFLTEQDFSTHKIRIENDPPENWAQKNTCEHANI